MTPVLDRLVADVTREFETAPAGRPPGARIAELLTAYAGEHDDWREFALFSPEAYTRNQIALHARFHLLLLCWGAGQESPIHNHEGQDCWMGVLDGRLEEVRYCTPDEVRPGPLEPRGARAFDRGEVAFIKDEIGLHLVRPADPGQAAASLHLYAAPYGSCNVYCPDTGQVTRSLLANHSVRGVPLGR